ALYVLQHLFGLHALEFAPTQGALVNESLLFCWPITVFGWYPRAFEFGGVGIAGELCVRLALEIQLVQALHKQQIRDLRDGSERVAHAATPEFVPELGDVAFEFGVVLQHVDDPWLAGKFAGWQMAMAPFAAHS